MHNVQTDDLVMPTGHSKLQNTTHMHKCDSWIKRGKFKIIRDVSAAELMICCYKNKNSKQT